MVRTTDFKSVNRGSIPRLGVFYHNAPRLFSQHSFHPNQPLRLRWPLLLICLYIGCNFQIMRKDYGNRCSGCTQIYREMLELDCGHPVCITCLEHLVKREENQEDLKDGLEIECPSCSYETIISIALAYKLIRPAREMNADQHQKRCRSMVCMNCLNECFAIDDYLQGKHANHEVLPMEQAYSTIKDILSYEEKQLEEAVNKLYFQIQKFAHCKGMLNDIFNANVMRIKLAFESLREELLKREMEILDDYEERIHEKFNLIDLSISENKKNIELSRGHLEWIEGNIGNERNNCERSSEMYDVVNYFLFNHDKINHLTLFTNSGRIAALMEDFRENRQIVNLQDFKQVAESIRDINMLRFDDESTLDSSAASFSRTYFDSKRKQLLNSRNYNDKLAFKAIAPQLGRPKPIRGDFTLKKVASLKCKLFNF